MTLKKKSKKRKDSKIKGNLAVQLILLSRLIEGVVQRQVQKKNKTLDQSPLETELDNSSTSTLYSQYQHQIIQRTFNNIYN